MAEGGDYFEVSPSEVEADDILFANENPEKYKEDFMVACTFARELFKDVLLKYNLESLASGSSFMTPDTGILSPYCKHIGEAVVVVSYTNRLKFKIIFDQILGYLMENDFHFEKITLDFIKSIYVHGFVEQFLVVCSFMIELSLYVCVKLYKNITELICYLFGDIFRYVMRDIFYENGGWNEVKRQCRPWWHTYRNYYYHRELEILAKGPNAQLAYGAELHKPLDELSNDNLTAIMLYFGFSTEIRTMKNYPDVDLSDVVPKPVSRLSPICELEGTTQEARTEPEGKEAEGKETKVKPKGKHCKKKYKR